MPANKPRNSKSRVPDFESPAHPASRQEAPLCKALQASTRLSCVYQALYSSATRIHSSPTVEVCTLGSAKDSAGYAEDGAIKVCAGDCTRSSKICTVQGTVQENEYGGVSSFARGEILACTLPAQGETPLVGEEALFNSLERFGLTIPSSWD